VLDYLILSDEPTIILFGGRLLGSRPSRLEACLMEPSVEIQCPTWRDRTFRRLPEKERLVRSSDLLAPDDPAVCSRAKPSVDVQTSL
jgi:hypothetical protein